MCHRMMATFPPTKARMETSGTAEAPSSILEQDRERSDPPRHKAAAFSLLSLCNLSPALPSKNCGRAEFIFESPDCFYSSMNYLLHAVLLTQTST